MTRRALGRALLVMVMLVTAACTGEAEPAPTGTIEAAPDPTPTATAPATAEPTPEPTEPTLTVEEAQEILDELAPIEGDVFRMLKYAGDEVPPPAYERLEAVHAEPSLTQGREALPELLANARDSESLRGGDPIREVLHVRIGYGNCVEVEVRRDFSEVFEGSPPVLA